MFFNLLARRATPWRTGFGGGPMAVGGAVISKDTKPEASVTAGVMPAVRRGLFRKYVVLFVAVVSLALAINGASDIWFSYQEQQALLFRIQRGQAQSAADKISQFVSEITAGLTWETQLS